MGADRTVQLALPLLLVLAGPALASRVTVPGDYASIQSAIDSAADTVLVSTGFYPENLVVARGVILLNSSMPGGYDEQLLAQTLALSVLPLPVMYRGSPTLTVRGLGFHGPVELPSSQDSRPQLSVNFQLCRMDSGVTQFGWGCVCGAILYLNVESCAVFGSAILASSQVYFQDNSVEGGGVRLSGEGSVFAGGNTIHGPATVGIYAHSDGPAQISNNTVTGVVDGIVCDERTLAIWNSVSDCSGRGIVKLRDAESVSNNLVQRCGGYGIDALTGPGEITENRVLSCGGGIHVSPVPDNYDHIIVTKNVVGRCSGSGMDVAFATVSDNTCFLNAGSGFVVSDGSLQGNIGCGNGAFGVSWDGSGTAPTLECNDWFGNVAGATLGVPPGSTDLALNPLFCDLPSDDVHLSAASPLAAAPGCGLIGALGVGCEWAVSVDEPVALAQPTFSVFPSPSRGRISFAIRGVNTAAAVEVFDLSGARRWHGGWKPGGAALEWNGTDDSGQPVAPGIYYARLTSRALVRSAKVVFVR